MFESLEWEQVEEVRIETANPRSRTAPAIGAVIGAVVGGIGGYAMGHARGDDPPSDCCFDLFGDCPEQKDCRLISLSAEAKGTLAMIPGATVGTAVGALLGYVARTSLRRTHRFRSEPTSAVAWGVQPMVGVDRTRGVVLQVRF